MQKEFVPAYPEFKISLSHKNKQSELFPVSDSKDAAVVARKVFEADTIDWVETFIVIGLNRASKVIGFYKVSQGGVTGTVADPRVVLQFALLSNATALIIAHNHPSGGLKPSRADEELTQKIKGACQFFDIRLADHIILTSESYYSFNDEGLL